MGGLHKYTFLNLCREDPRIELGDETEKIYLCAQGRAQDVSENMKAFLGFVATGIPEDPFTENLQSIVEEAKYHKRWRKEYMTLLEHYEMEREEGREEGRKEGLEVGREEGLLISIRNLMDSMKISAEKAMELLSIPLSEQDKYRNRL